MILARRTRYMSAILIGLVLVGGIYDILRRYPKEYYGISVPPRPYTIINNWTLAGVDSNQNGVRDDVERYIAEAVKGDKNNYALAIDYERNREDLMINPSPEKIFRQHCETLQVDQPSRTAIVKASSNWLNTKMRWDRNTEIYTSVFKIPDCGPNWRP
jgi:hypothetical protein